MYCILIDNLCIQEAMYFHTTAPVMNFINVTSECVFGNVTVSFTTLIVSLCCWGWCDGDVGGLRSSLMTVCRYTSCSCSKVYVQEPIKNIFYAQ